MDDICASSRDIETLAELCVKEQLIRCDLCEHCEPNAGYDAPYCLKRTELGEGSPGNVTSSACKGKPPYRLRLGTIPEVCPYWTSRAQAAEEKRRQHLMREAKNAARKAIRILHELGLSLEETAAILSKPD